MDLAFESGPHDFARDGDGDARKVERDFGRDTRKGQRDFGRDSRKGKNSGRKRR
jgi:hypothetical protein